MLALPVRGWMVGIVALLLLTSVGTAFAQTTGTGEIHGTVKDSAGAPIPGVRVTVTNVATGTVRTVDTDAQGAYVITGLPPGAYTVAAVTTTGVPATVVVVSQVGVTATPGTATPMNAEAAMVQTDKADLQKESNTLRILELPGRNEISGLATLENGVVPEINPRTPKNQPNKTDLRSPFAVNGHRVTSNTYYIDGAYNLDPINGTARQNLPPEPMQEFQMNTTNYSAERGRNSGADVNVVTRSGSNDFHGIAQYTWNHSSFDALSELQGTTFNALRSAGISDSDATRLSRGTTKDDIASFQVGGPIVPNHAFFFVEGGYDWFRSTAPPAPTLAISPDGLATLQANQSMFAPGALNFLTSNFPVANDPTMRGLAMIQGCNVPLAVNLEQFNRGFSDVINYRTDTWHALPKVDFKWGTQDFLSARYFIDGYRTPGIPTSLPGFEANENSRKQNLTISENHIFGSAGVNEARFSYGRIRDTFLRQDQLNLIVEGFNTAGQFLPPRDRNDRNYQAEDNYTHIMGRHTLRFGGSYLRYRFNGSFAPDTAGTLIYPSLSDLLLDKNAIFASFAGTGLVDEAANQWTGFAQDDIKLARSFTLNLGVRYEWQGLPAGFFNGSKADNNNWSPRFGFAWSPGAPGFLHRGVLRGGYGLLYDQSVVWQVMPYVSRNFPLGVTLVEGPVSGADFFNPANRPLAPTAAQFSAAGGNPNLLPLVEVSPNDRVRMPYDQRYSLGWEQQFGANWAFRAFYVGSRGMNRWSMVEANPGFTAQAIAANPAFFAPLNLGPNGRLDANSGSILSIEPIGRSWYNSGQFSLEKRFSAGLQFSANYTFSKYLDTSDSILGVAPANPFDLRAEYGRSSLDQPHRLVANWVYSIPTMFDSGMMNRLVSGWELSGIMTWASGLPYSVYNAQNALGILPGAIPDFLVGNQRATIGSGIGFTVPDINSGLTGNLGRNTQRLPRIFDWNMALVKNTLTRGSQSLQLRWEVFNVFNRQRRFGELPYNVIGSDVTGRSLVDMSEAANPARSMLFTVRYLF